MRTQFLFFLLYIVAMMALAFWLELSS